VNHGHPVILRIFGMSVKRLLYGRSDDVPIHYVGNDGVSFLLHYTQGDPSIFGSHERAFLPNARHACDLRR
jgi:hypothetical protein